jgi:hypothetical protein
MWEVLARKNYYGYCKNGWTWCGTLFENICCQSLCENTIVIWSLLNNSHNHVWWHYIIEWNWTGTGNHIVKLHNSINWYVNIDLNTDDLVIGQWLSLMKGDSFHFGWIGVLADRDGIRCCLTQINQCKCAFSTSLQLKRVSGHDFETQFLFSVMVVMELTNMSVSF